MKKNIILFFISISCLACSNGQSKQSFNNATQDLATEILGCWEMVNMYYDVKSNHPEIDSLILKDRQKSIEKKQGKSYITIFSEDEVTELKENIPNENPSIYIIKEDSLLMRGTFRQDENSAKIKIKNDSLLLELDAIREFKYISRNLKIKNEIDIPKDLKLEKMVRHVTYIRLKDCDQYKQENE